MRLTRLAAAALIIILMASVIACGSDSGQEPTPTPTATPTLIPTIVDDSSFIQLLTPEPGSTVETNTPLFTWTSVASASDYRLQIAAHPDFRPADIIFDETLGNIQSYVIDYELENDVYYWRVKATSSSTETPWSPLGSFVIDTEVIFHY